MSAGLDLSEKDQRVGRDILRASAPPEAIVWAFGSRTTGRARRYSDLDLAIDAGRQLTIRDMALLQEAFDESELSYRVDIVDWRTLDDAFRRRIAGELVAFVGAPDDGPDPAAPQE